MGNAKSTSRSSGKPQDEARAAVADSTENPSTAAAASASPSRAEGQSVVATGRSELAALQPAAVAAADAEPSAPAAVAAAGPAAPAAAEAAAAAGADAGPAGAAGTGAVKVVRGHYDILRGTLDPDNPLALLRGNEHMWSDIFGRVDDWYKLHINRDCVAYHIIKPRRQPIVFPEPQGLDINMMPILLLQRLPPVCAQYNELVWACLMPRSNYGRVGYLTIQESLVPVGEAHRRPGLHIESPRSIIADGGELIKPGHERFQSLNWGHGCYGLRGVPVGGIYMASSLANSTRVWPVLIENPVEVTDGHGGIEHMRERLGEGKDLEANELCWFTDRTPHESLPLRAPAGNPTATHVYRQFFRLVVGKIDVWYSKHNTPNPLGVQPEARISDEDKFATAAFSASASS